MQPSTSPLNQEPSTCKAESRLERPKMAKQRSLSYDGYTVKSGAKIQKSSPNRWDQEPENVEFLNVTNERPKVSASFHMKRRLVSPELPQSEEVSSQAISEKEEGEGSLE